MKLMSLWLAALIAVGAQAPCLGNSITLDHVDRGSFYSPTASPFFGDAWKIVGGSYQIRAFDAGVTVPVARNYTVFDLSSVSGQITGATLRMYLDAGGLDTSAASEEVGFYEVTTSPARLLAGDAASNPELIYPDLGNGPLYGSLTATPADEGSYLEATLTNPAVLAALNSAAGNGAWAVGGALLTLDGSFEGGNERVFRSSGTGDPVTQLVLTVVPEPTSVALLGFASFSLATCRRRSSQS